MLNYMDNKFKIVIATGIYPPDIGGPAQYAKNLAEEFQKTGHSIKVVTFRIEKKLPTGIRHLFYFFRILPSLFGVDFIIALDTFSVGLPTVLAAKILRKKVIIRTGGDFLWESYVERTGDMVLFREFYKTRFEKFNLKEKIIFRLTKFTLKFCSAVVFSVEWQKDIFTLAYSLNSNINFIVENFYGPKIEDSESDNFSKKIFISATRPLKWKNHEMLKKAFLLAQKENKDIVLDEEPAPYEKFLEKIKNCYAVILVSLGDISPNMILDAIRAEKPFILTKENGLNNRLKDIGVFVDPLNIEDIKNKILFLSDSSNYKIVKEKIKQFNFTHLWTGIYEEFISIYKKIQ